VNNVESMERYNIFSVEGKNILITGSSSGIGYSLAMEFASRGAMVFINGRNSEKLEKAVTGLRKKGYKVRGLAFNVFDEQTISEELAKLDSEEINIDVLVNNAGIQIRSPLEKLSTSDWEEVLKVNLSGSFIVSREVARYMIPRKKGKIINICSLMSEIGRPTTGPYTASKGGLKMLTRAMTVEWASHNLQVNGIGPGYFKTEMTRPLFENSKFDSWIKDRTPSGRWGEVDELAGAAIFLASDASSFVNGQIIYVDGGLLSGI